MLTIQLMAECASTISYSMQKSSNDRLERLFASIPGRVGLVILTAMVSAVALLLLFWADLNISPYLLAAVVLTGIGLISGMASRWILRRNTAALRLLAALTALSFSLALIGVITNGAIGLNLEPKTLDNPDWIGLLQISWSGIVTWLALRAWRKPIRIKEPVSKTPKSRPKRISMPKVKAPKPRVKSRPWRNLSEKLARPTLKIRSGSKASTSTKRRPVRVSRTPKTSRMSLRNLRLNRRKESVKLVGREEHNCPYCLEIVEKGDPRGVKICSICKTWHHADCWAVTGACQVPHEH